MENSLTFKVQLSFKAHSIAQGLSLHFSDIQYAKQIYLNTLGIYAVEFYLQCMGFETDWEIGDSRDVLLLKFLNVADLPVRGIGKLECRSVLPNAKVCHIPPEALANRIGSVIVRLTPSLKQAILLGFTPIVDREIYLDRLQSLEAFMEHLHRIKQTI
jgi:Protein of unknown function (DUF1822)